MDHAFICTHLISLEIHSGAVSGYVSWIGNVAERNASLTEILIESGAVLYVRTNVPQTLMVRFIHNLELLSGVPDSLYLVAGNLQPRVR